MIVAFWAAAGQNFTDAAQRRGSQSGGVKSVPPPEMENRRAGSPAGSVDMSLTGESLRRRPSHSRKESVESMDGYTSDHL